MHAQHALPCHAATSALVTRHAHRTPLLAKAGAQDVGNAGAGVAVRPEHALGTLIREQEHGRGTPAQACT